MIDRLKCLLFGHKRGKPTGETKNPEGKVLSRSFKCPRCPATWTRKFGAS